MIVLVFFYYFKRFAFHGRCYPCLVKPEEAFADLEKATGNKFSYKKNTDTAEEILENLGHFYILYKFLYSTFVSRWSYFKPG